MIRLPLTIGYRAARLRETVAWLTPGDGAESWLAELTRWGVDLRGVAIRPLPRSRHDATPSGALVTVAPGAGPRCSAGCQEYGCIAERLFLPVDAQLAPEALESEVADLLAGSDDEYVFHPGFGLVRVPGDARLRVSDLLQAPPRAETDWNWGKPGQALCSRLVSVEPEQETSIETILQAGRGDIGTRDPGKGVPRPAAKSGERGSSRAGNAADSERGGLLSRMLRGLRAAVGGWKSAVSALSQQEQLDRLLKLLQQDPDEGLRYALPLAGSAHRGAAPPSDQLVRRNVDFNLQQLAGGQPASTWYATAQQFEDLRRYYRDLANREVRLGRHRRAAYIFAHLLDDLLAAAAALASGGHWREAAVLYRDRLQQPLAAAQCLEKGGLWTEAIEAYQKLEAWEKAGDVYRKLDQREEADAAYRQAAEQRLAAHDFADAARLWEHKLNAPAEALVCLAAGWPGSNQAGKCLEETFRILTRLGQHDQTAKWIERIGQHPLAVETLVQAVKVLADTAHTHPESAIRDLAADKARITAGPALAGLPDNQARELLLHIGRLVPQDRLLRRDCERFQQIQQSRRGKAALRIGRRRGGLMFLWKFRLAGHVEWTAATSTDGFWYFAGYDRGRVLVARWSWGQTIQDYQTVEWSVSPALVGAPVLLGPDLPGRSGLLAHVVGSASVLRAEHFLAEDGAPSAERIGPHRGFSAQTHGVARSSDGLLWLVDRKEGELVLSTYGPGDQLLSSQAVPWPAGLDAHGTASSDAVPFSAGRTHVFLGMGDCLLCIKRGVGASWIRMPSTIRRLGAPPDEFPDHIVVSCADQVLICWLGAAEPQVEELHDKILDPFCCCTRRGRIVIADGKDCEVYQRSGRHFEHVATDSISVEGPIAILPARQPDQIMVCNRDGDLQGFRVL